MECPKCGFDNPTDSSFCNKCGTQITAIREETRAATETIQIPIKELTPGSTFAKRYQIIEELGKGGMGRVYKVLDNEIGEKVALKLLNPEIAAESKTIERFRNELKTARQISHKNVCRMYHLSKEEGTPYIIMEYVRGEDLKSMIRMMGRLSPGQTVSIAKQVCEGLGEAHRLGVVHRDLKSQNIMIDRNGDVKIMDFGIARTLQTKGITGEGVMIGTPEYMSPEQAEAKEADERADIYALGIILFEMLTGRVPFEGETPLSIALKHKTEAPPDPRKINPQMPDDLARLILRCLEKEKGNRYQSTQELGEEFTKIEKAIPTEEKILPQKRPLTSKEVTIKIKKRWRAVAAVAVVAVVAVAAVLYFGRVKPISIAATGAKRVVVLPFENLGPPEDEYFADGITDEITARLASISQLEVIGRSSAVQYKKTEKSPRQIGEELGVTHILSGTVRWQRQPGGTSKVRVTPSLVRVSDAMQVWANPYDETIAEVFQVQSDIALRVAEALNVALLEPEQKTLEAKLTNYPEAYDYYLQGREYTNRGTENRENVTMSIEMFMKAVELDPNFIPGYAGLAVSHARMYWYHFEHTEERAAKSKEAADKALELGPDLPEAHYALGFYYYHCRLDYEHSLEHLSIALEKQPKNADILETIAYVKRRQGKLAESLDYLKKALKIDPRSIEIITNMGDSYHLLRDYPEAERYYEQAISLSPDYISSYISHGSLAWVYLHGLGNTTKAREVLDEVSSKTLSPDEEDMLQYNWTLVNIFEKTYQEALDHIHLMPSDAYYDQFMFVPKSQLYAQIYGLMGDAKKELEYYNSARISLENRIKEQPDDTRLYSALGITCAGLGLNDRAIQEAKKATELLPVSKEFWRGTLRVKDLAEVYVMVGEYDKAFDQIEYLLSIPGELSIPLLKLDPVWAPLRTLPRFQKLVQKFDLSQKY